jgi:hypothetical protein
VSDLAERLVDALDDAAYANVDFPVDAINARAGKEDG